MSEHPTPSLRERQKQDRRKRIIAAAKQLFRDSGLEKITIEAIAEIAGVSAVTVHNYYGTKSGVLLALVADSDAQLILRLQENFCGKHQNLDELMLNFYAEICSHTMSHLDKAIWRQVMAASVNGSEPRFHKTYQALDAQLVALLEQEILRLVEAGVLPPETEALALAWALFNLQNARFLQFITLEDPKAEAQIHEALAGDLRALRVLGLQRP